MPGSTFNYLLACLQNRIDRLDKEITYEVQICLAAAWSERDGDAYQSLWVAGVLRFNLLSMPSLVTCHLLITRSTSWFLLATSQFIDRFLVMQETKEVASIGDNRPSVHDGPPDGGLLAWLQVAGSFCLYFCTWGTISVCVSMMTKTD